jgi:XTP/dITP diphosphohydrolase
MKIKFATGNSEKVEHAQNILSNQKVRQLEIETKEPQSESIQEIAKAKIKQAKEKAEIEEDAYLIADDSGLFIPALNGFPGPQTGFFDKTVGRENILKLLENKNKKAEFKAAIALHTSKGQNKVFTGKAEGKIVEPRGDGGFGYDPLFQPKGKEKTWGEKPELKDKKSHREQALNKLKNHLTNL